MKTLFFFYPNNFLWQYTLNLTLANLAEKYHYTYKTLAYNTEPSKFLKDLKIDKNCELAFFEDNPEYNEEDCKEVKRAFPNAKIIMFSGDSLYHKRLSADTLTWKVDLCIETIKKITENSSIIPCEHFYWNISETLIEQIKQTTLSTVKTNYAISLCNMTSKERASFLTSLTNEGCIVHWDLKLFKLIDIYNRFAQNWVSIGHTTPVWTGAQRSMKGFRDWIAPFCGTVLIYDDYPDIIDIGEEIVPTYQYIQIESAIKLINKLKNDSALYAKYLRVQKKWAIENSLEAQLIRILTKHKML